MDREEAITDVDALAASIDKTAADVILPTESGELRLSEQLGKVTLLYFAAPGCPSCGASGPLLNRIHFDYQDQGPGVQVVAINISSQYSLEEWIRYWKKTVAGSGVEAVQLAQNVGFDKWEGYWDQIPGAKDVVWSQDSGGAASRKYRIWGTGTILLIDQKGVVTFRGSMLLVKERTLRAEIEKLVGSPPTVGNVALSTIGTVQVYPDFGAGQHFPIGQTPSQSGYAPYRTEYRSDPPVSGAHWPDWVTRDIYFGPLPAEQLLHSLEHGYVIIYYNCGSSECPGQLADLTKIYDRYPSKVIINFRPQTRSRIALAAWTRLDLLDKFDEARIVKFIETYRGKIGPEADAPS